MSRIVGVRRFMTPWLAALLLSIALLAGLVGVGGQPAFPWAGVAHAQATVDYDTDDDNLIEISNLAQLNAVRWDPDGDGTATSGNETAYAAAFPNPAAGMGCAATCTGYELTTHLDLDTNGNGEADSGDDYWYNGDGWDPIGSIAADYFDATFEGNHFIIYNLHISRYRHEVGLFGYLKPKGVIRNIHLVNVNVTARGGGWHVGALVGYVQNGNVSNSSVEGGSVSGGQNIGGLVGSKYIKLGSESGVIDASYAAVTVSGTSGRRADRTQPSRCGQQQLRHRQC